MVRAQGMQGAKSGRYLLGVLLLAVSCHKAFGDFSAEETSGTSCAPGVVQCAGNLLQRCNPEGSGWKNVDVCGSAALCDQSQASCRKAECADGARRCVGAQLQGCSATRDGWTEITTCATAAHCSAEAGACSEQPCEPAMIQCNGAVLQSCRSDRSGWDDLQTCDSAALCNAKQGECIGRICDAGAVRCDGAQLLSCKPELDGWITLKTCDSAALCDEAGRTCREAGCTTPGAFRCDPEGALERCADDLSGWTFVEGCESKAHCDALNGTCTEQPCAPGDSQCSGTMLDVCNADSTGWDSLDTCATDGLCQQTRALGQTSCVLPACEAGTYQCDGAQPQVCNSALTEFRDNGEACATAELCNSASGTCGVPVCDPGETRCTGTQPEICNPGQTMFIPHGSACASEALCRPETGTCGDVVCLSGQKQCDPTNPTRLRVCKPTLDGWDECATCATPELCSASLGATSCGPGACAQPSCSPQERWCGGNGNRTLYTCPPSLIRTQGVVLDVCETDGLCEVSRAEAGRMTCHEKSCSLPDRWCGGAGNRTLYKCPSSLINYQAVVLDVCETSGLCAQAHANPNALTCPAPACGTPGYSCGGTGSRTLQQCNAERTALTSCDTCDSAALCTNSLGATACNANSCHICVAGEKNCSGSQLRICNAARTGWDTRACGSAALCMNSLTPANQVTCDACIAGTFTCNGAQPQRCNDPGTGPAVWANMGEACDDAVSCNAATGECVSDGEGGAGGAGSTGGAGGAGGAGG